MKKIKKSKGGFLKRMTIFWKESLFIFILSQVPSSRPYVIDQNEKFEFLKMNKSVKIYIETAKQALL